MVIQIQSTFKFLSFLVLFTFGTINITFANPAPTPPVLSSIDGPQLDDLIKRANAGDLDVQDQLAARYHWANFPIEYLIKLNMNAWDNIEERARQDYQMHYMYHNRSGYTYPYGGNEGMTVGTQEYAFKQAERGRPEFQNLVGGVLSIHSGKNAETWFSYAAAQGFAPGQLNLGMLAIQEGNYDFAANLMQMAAEQGYANAQHVLAHMYFRGAGVDKDVVKAQEWLEKSAAQGFMPAQADLGAWCYLQGDDQKATTFLKLAASQGDKGAQNLMTHMATSEAARLQAVKAVEGYFYKLEIKWLALDNLRRIFMQPFMFGDLYFDRTEY